MVKFVNVINKFFKNYLTSTPTNLKIIDSYLLYVLLTGIIQFVYCILVGTFPFNSFLAGFISTVASFVLGTSLRIQVNEQNSKEFTDLSKEKAFAEFLFAHLVLHLVVFNFIG